MVSRETGHRHGEASAVCLLGSVLSALGRTAEAQENFERYLALNREIGDRRGEAYALHNLGDGLREQGESERSRVHLLACVRLCEEIGDRRLECATRLALGSLLTALGNVEGGRESLEAARNLAEALGVPGLRVGAHCELSALPGGGAEEAQKAYADHEDQLTASAKRGARVLLWRATGERAHIVEAKRLLDEALWLAPEEDRDAMCRYVRDNREILAAWCEEFGDEATGGAESVTRVR